MKANNRMNTCWYHRKEPAVTEVIYSQDYDTKIGLCYSCSEELEKAGGLTRALDEMLKSNFLSDRKKPI